MTCEDGEWLYEGSHVGPYYTCEPYCEPWCLNGGSCVAPNVCSCRPGYIGTECETYVGTGCEQLPDSILNGTIAIK